MAERGRCRRLPICEAELVGHRLMRVWISSSVQLPMSTLSVMAPQPPGTMPAVRGVILANSAFPQSLHLARVDRIARDLAIEWYTVQRPGGDGAARAFDSARRSSAVRMKRGQPSPDETPASRNTTCT
jgi:hypothetical protein